VFIDGSNEKSSEAGFAVVIPRDEYREQGRRDAREHDDEPLFGEEPHETDIRGDAYTANLKVEISSVEKIQTIPPEPEIPVTHETGQPEDSGKKGKRKLKRGKTTSAILTRTFQSDIEDDVLWVDEEPILKPAEDPSPAPLHQTDAPNDFATSHPEPAPEPRAVETNGPKKRGRKKKVAEPAAAEPPPAATEQANKDPESPADTTSAREPLGEQDTNAMLQPQCTPEKQTHHESREGSSTLGRIPNASTDIPPPKTAPQQTPTKPTASEKGPDKHSPIAKTNKAPLRVGLSRKARIAPLLRVIRK
jgi:hypothetical protein